MSEVAGIGTDIIEIGRIGKAITRYGERFLKRVFTSREREYCMYFSHPEQHYAGRFAAKEAIFKALGTGIRNEIRWQDVEIMANSYGKPEVVFSLHLKTLFPSSHVLVSISHSREYATATALLLQNRSLWNIKN